MLANIPKPSKVKDVDDQTQKYVQRDMLYSGVYTFGGHYFGRALFGAFTVSECDCRYDNACMHKHTVASMNSSHPKTHWPENLTQSSISHIKNYPQGKSSELHTTLLTTAQTAI